MQVTLFCFRGTVKNLSKINTLTSISCNSLIILITYPPSGFLTAVALTFSLNDDVYKDTDYEIVNVGDLRIGFDNGDSTINLENNVSVGSFFLDLFLT